MSQAGEKNEKARAQSGAQAQKRALGHMKNLNKFIGALDDYNSTIPEAVSKYYMQKNGVEGSDDRMVKLISLAADQFLARTIHESHQLYLLRTSVNPSTKKTSGGKRKREEASSAEIKDIPALFQTEDLQMALASQGIHIMAKKKS